MDHFSQFQMQHFKMIAHIIKGRARLVTIVEVDRNMYTMVYLRTTEMSMNNAEIIEVNIFHVRQYKLYAALWLTLTAYFCYFDKPLLH